MPSFNFKDEFVDAVVCGRKTTTIRQTLRAKVGDIAHLFCRQRTKDCIKLGEYKIIDVRRVEIENKGYTRIWRGNGVDASQGKRPLGFMRSRILATNDGFENAASMVAFFRKQYGLPFAGYLYQWEWNAPANTARFLTWEIWDGGLQVGTYGTYVEAAKFCLEESREHPSKRIVPAACRCRLMGFPEDWLEGAMQSKQQETRSCHKSHT